jgi:[acyl-carrier-protein] S-malonyltransferase
MTASGSSGTPAPDTAVLFPGISEDSFTGLDKFLLVNPLARELTEVADAALGGSLVDGLRAADGQYTALSRAAFLVGCVALAGWAEQEHGVRPLSCVGPSFGGTAAAVYAGALDLADAVRLTVAWGRVFEEYFARADPGVVTQSLARLPGPVLAEILADLGQAGHWHDVAGYVDTDFHLVSVLQESLELLQQRVRAVGGLPLYTMRQPLHSALFAPLREVVEAEVFTGVRFADPRISVVGDHDGRLLASAEQVRTLLLDAIVRPVRWLEVVSTLSSRGVSRLWVAGTDGLWSRVNATVEAFTVVPVTPQLALRPRPAAAVSW